MNEEQDWYFTFGCGQENAGRFACINGTFGSARDEMFKRFGDKWCMQYGSAEEAGVDRWQLTQV